MFVAPLPPFGPALSTPAMTHDLEAAVMKSKLEGLDVDLFDTPTPGAVPESA